MSYAAIFYFGPDDRLFHGNVLMCVLSYMYIILEYKVYFNKGCQKKKTVAVVAKVHHI